MSCLDTMAGDSCLTIDIMSFSHPCHGSCIFHIATRMTAVCSQLCYVTYKGEISLRSKRNRFVIGKKGKRHDNDRRRRASAFGRGGGLKIGQQ
jgi:hypothetical protein